MVQAEIIVDKIKVVTHNMFSNTDQSGDQEDPDPIAVGRVSVAGKPQPGVEPDSPKRGQFNKLFAGGSNQQTTRKRPGQGSPQYGLDQGVFRITFNKGNVRITARDIKECSKPLEDFVDEDISKLVDGTCVDADHSTHPDSER